MAVARTAPEHLGPERAANEAQTDENEQKGVDYWLRDFCDAGAAAYTGYIDIEARHLFFYFFESRRDPGRDDVVFWTSGGAPASLALRRGCVVGPGCSAALGLFMQLGAPRPRDMSKKCAGAYEETIALFPLVSVHLLTFDGDIAAYLSHAHTRAALGVDPRAPPPFSECAPSVISAFAAAHDALYPPTAALLDRGVRVLVYAGANDIVCNCVGNARWVSELDGRGRGVEGGGVEGVGGSWEGGGTDEGREQGGAGVRDCGGGGAYAPCDKPAEWMAGEV
ncbi:hypothetical protein GLOTRDRAFT_125026 [Gloeophyllum trabeum ATCC 11539]|uniref:Alpha/beta-hydrolase n=1 Tax=Gloeophyllum trabeum (strain ATCC 11539 / FP-39264 / Madison 617) TaxID=670483 RepID=S7S1H4_GLOTA|nr:uncharacterized protein GLOTRDRAFT_125026 [Gloeophyllum trabeum ATCC 11539]EPQ61305.1 hypothetical protein GLOTRDRAFT_125026 [Gloeophyllum trabeum ATCC 11539]